MSGIGALGLEPVDAPPTPEGLPKHLRDVDWQLHEAEDVIDCLRIELNRFRLAIEDIAVDDAVGMRSNDMVDRLRKISTSFACGHEGLAGHVRAARARIRSRARSMARRRAPSADVIPLRPPKQPVKE